jgi:hypothetical protein
MSAWSCRSTDGKPANRLFRLVFESHDGRAWWIPKRSKSPRATSTLHSDSLKALDLKQPIREADIRQGDGDRGRRPQCRVCRTTDRRGSPALHERSIARGGSQTHTPRPASGSSVPDRSTADPWTNNEVLVHREAGQIESSIDLPHQVIFGDRVVELKLIEKLRLFRPSADPSWLALAAIRVSKMESLFAACLNGLLQQNLPKAGYAAGNWH